MEGEVHYLKKSLRTIQKRIGELEEVESVKFVSPSIEKENDSNSQLLSLVNHIHSSAVKDITDATRRMAFSLFTEEELLNCSRTGKTSVKSTNGVGKSALADKKLEQLERAVSKFPSLNKDDFKKKIDNVVKMLRREDKKRLN